MHANNICNNNMYSPNQEKLRFLSSVMSRLESFGTKNIILVWDLNTPLIPRLDISSGKSSISPTSLTKLRSLHTKMSLVDVWRVPYTSGRDYTYFSPAHCSYSHIDYLLISQSLLDSNPSPSIGLRLWSDHAPDSWLYTSA